MEFFPDIIIDANKELTDKAAVMRCLRMSRIIDAPVKLCRDGFSTYLYPHFDQEEGELLMEKARRNGEKQDLNSRMDFKSQKIYLHKYIHMLPDIITRGDNSVIDWIEGLAHYSRRELYVEPEERQVIAQCLESAGYKTHKPGSNIDVDVSNKKAVAHYIVGAFLNQLKADQFSSLRFQYMNKILREYWSFKDPKPSPLSRAKIVAEKKQPRP